ncbi:hypothetical protein RISK_002140 [Rhodopirellula islandica]|uniref:Uncharacterized protein n=1 Tax=Rhodopirellula islandica TaxID=595434 RepID=A0A0J1BG42_RHOIS|nr:hypothetical protein RISK_002140 [Rhodopirellula islandica]
MVFAEWIQRPGVTPVGSRPSTVMGTSKLLRDDFLAGPFEGRPWQP